MSTPNSIVGEQYINGSYTGTELVFAVGTHLRQEPALCARARAVDQCGH